MPSNHLTLCCPLLLLPSIFPSIMVFSNESAVCIRWPKYWSFRFSISPSNKYSGLISFRLTGLISLLSKGLSRVLRTSYSHLTTYEELSNEHPLDKPAPTCATGFRVFWILNSVKAQSKLHTKAQLQRGPDHMAQHSQTQPGWIHGCRAC